MSNREHVAADLGRHLAEDLQRTVERHRAIAEAGGASVVEWTAAMLIAVEATALHGMAGLVVFVEEAKRGEVFDVAAPKLHGSLTDRRATVLKAARMTDAMFRR